MKVIIGFCLVLSAHFAHASTVKVGSKAFTEGYLLGELAAQTLETKNPDLEISRQFGLGNTGIVFEALRKGEIDFYAEYTGTITEAILHQPNLSNLSEIARRLGELDLVMSPPIGFSNTYALAVTREFAEGNKLKTISDLARVGTIVRMAFSHEFTTRTDGLQGLQKKYRLHFTSEPESLEHSLAYEAVANRKVDLIDVYSTDSQIDRLNLVVLEDDLKFFPSYQAVYLARKDFVTANAAAWSTVSGITDVITEAKMRKLNASAEIDKKSFSSVIGDFLGAPVSRGRSVYANIFQRTKEHLFLVGVTVLLAIITGVPLGIIAVRRERLGQFLLLMSSIVQTVPSLALLCLLIPVFGIGVKPALVALYLYSLLPILLNTYIGLSSIEPRLLETSRALGLNLLQRIWWIELPIASPSIIGGIKTATIIGIGMATLAALIGAGGYGAPIVSGLAVNDMRIVLQGAIPAACMSLLAHFGFELLGRWFVPRGLRLKS